MLQQLQALIHTALNRGHSWSQGQIFRGIKRKWNNSRILEIYGKPALRFPEQTHSHSQICRDAWLHIHAYRHTNTWAVHPHVQTHGDTCISDLFFRCGDWWSITLPEGTVQQKNHTPFPSQVHTTTSTISNQWLGIHHNVFNNKLGFDE